MLGKIRDDVIFFLDMTVMTLLPFSLFFKLCFGFKSRIPSKGPGKAGIWESKQSRLFNLFLAFGVDLID